MSIRLTYSCTCGYATPILDNAQKHADSTGHTVDVRGTITERNDVASVKAIDASDQIRKKARELEIMRVARARGLGGAR